MVREVSEDGWGGRRQDPLAMEVAAEGEEPKVLSRTLTLVFWR
jgi:hypothetical protein